MALSLCHDDTALSGLTDSQPQRAIVPDGLGGVESSSPAASLLRHDQVPPEARAWRSSSFAGLAPFHDAGPHMLRRLLHVLVCVSSCRELMMSFVHAAGDVTVTL